MHNEEKQKHKRRRARMSPITKLQIKMDRIEMLIRFRQDQIYSAMGSLDLNLDIKNEIILETAEEIRNLRKEKESLLQKEEKKTKKLC